jgi:hypothetical protein
MELDRNCSILMVALACLAAVLGCARHQDVKLEDTAVYGVWRVVDFGPYQGVFGKTIVPELTLKSSHAFTATGFPMEAEASGGIPVIKQALAGSWRLENDIQADSKSSVFIYLNSEPVTFRIRLQKRSNDLVMEYVIDPEREPVLLKRVGDPVGSGR